MLVSLSIRDFVLIEKLDLGFARAGHGGLGALTGETGAGKSILIDALALPWELVPIPRPYAGGRRRLQLPPLSTCPRPIPRMRSSPNKD